jgi:hypothetical protein
MPVEGDGETVMGLEGIVSKRKDSPYRSGRSPDWLKMKNTDAGEARSQRGLGPMSERKSQPWMRREQPCHL